MSDEATFYVRADSETAVADAIAELIPGSHHRLSETGPLIYTDTFSAYVERENGDFDGFPITVDVYGLGLDDEGQAAAARNLAQGLVDQFGFTVLVDPDEKNPRVIEPRHAATA